MSYPISLELILPDPLVDARYDFLNRVMHIREEVILNHGGVLNNDVYEGPATAAINELTGKFLYLLDGGELDNGGYTVLPNHMINNGLAGTLPNLAGDLGPTYDSFFEDINN